MLGAGERKGASSLHSGEGSLCLLLSRKSYQKSEKSPPVCPRCSSTEFKTPNFRDLVWCRTMLFFWGRVSPCQNWYRFVPEGSHTKAQEHRIWSKAQQRASVQASHLPSLCRWWGVGQSNGTCHLFCPRRGNATLPDVLQEERTIPPSASQGILRLHCLLPDLCPPLLEDCSALRAPHWSHHRPFKTSVFGPHWL